MLFNHKTVNKKINPNKIVNINIIYYIDVVLIYLYNVK